MEMNLNFYNNEVILDATTQQKLVNFTNRLYTCRDSYDIEILVDEFKSINNPYFYQAAAQTCLSLNDYSNALPLFKKAISYGLNFSYKYWDDQVTTDAIGSSISKILTLFIVGNTGKAAENLYALGYCYLSKCIQQLGVSAFESYEARANLVNYTHPVIKNSIMPLFAISEVYAISDYFYSGAGLSRHGYSSEAYKNNNKANEIHDWLEDITVAGKDADKYSLEEIVEIGKKRHDKLFSTLQKDFKNNKYSISGSELNKIFNSVERPVAS